MKVYIVTVKNEADVQYVEELLRSMLDGADSASVQGLTKRRRPTKKATDAAPASS